MNDKQPAFYFSHAGLRGVLALIVLPLHINIEKVFPAAEKYLDDFFVGSYAVDIFFVLSGFILSVLYRKKIYDFTSYRKYLVARVARIFPLHYLTILAVICIICISKLLNLSTGNDYEAHEIIPQLFLLQSWVGVETSSWVVTSWSLSAEFLAYIISPLIFFFLNKCNNFKVVTNLFISVILIVACSFLYDISDVFNLGRTRGLIATLRVLFCFTAGCFIGVIMERKPLIDNRYLGKIVDLFTALVISLYLLSFPCHLIHRMFLYSVTPLWLILLAYDEKCITTSFLGSKIAVYLGAISYSIYLLHPLAGKVVYYVSGKSYVNNYILIGATILIVVIVSSLVYEFFEKPSRNALRRFIK